MLHQSCGVRDRLRCLLPVASACFCCDRRAGELAALHALPQPLRGAARLRASAAIRGWGRPKQRLKHLKRQSTSRQPANSAV